MDTPAEESAKQLSELGWWLPADGHACTADGQADEKTPGTDTTNYIAGKVVRAAGAAGGIATIELLTVPVRAS